MPSEVKKLEKTSSVNNVRVALINACRNDYDERDRNFPFEFMQLITSYQLNFDKPNLGERVDTWMSFTEYTAKEIADFASELVDTLSHTFTLRHYDKHMYSEIKSNFALPIDSKITETNTRKSDWLDLGNTAFTFWLFCIDGEVPPRGFLRSTKYYDEIALDDGSLEEADLQNAEFFASSDLLANAKRYREKKIEPPVLLKGKIRDIAKIIFGYIMSSAGNHEEAKNVQEMLETIERRFPSFEVKIPGTVTGSNWKPK